jgi:hypothetical protein
MRKVKDFRYSIHGQLNNSNLISYFRHILDVSISTEWVILVPMMKDECEAMIWKLDDDCVGIRNKRWGLVWKD